MTIHSVVIQKLLSTNAQLGRRVTAHHFKVYTYGVRNAMTIIDSDKTLICLRNACQFIGNLVRQKGRFLFVNTNSLCDEIVEQMTKRIGCGGDSSWRLSGFLTNSGSPKKFRSRNKKLHLGSTHPPDCVVIMDTERKSSVIFEADKLQIPIVGLVDSSMPWDIYKRITYPVPANASVQFVYLFCNLITKTFLLEQRRFAAATGANVREESENIVQSKTRSVIDEVIVVPYESLTLVSDDSLENKRLMDKLVVLKLNGCLGTKMGFNGPKSAIEVCNGLTYLDLIVYQIQSLNSKHGCNIPLILMNTTKTHDGTLKVVENFSKTNVDIYTLCQSQGHQLKKGEDSENELYHFDHRELYLLLENSGTLDSLMLEGKEYILVLKSENVGAVIDTRILNHLIQNRTQYCMEVMPNSSPDFNGSIPSSQEENFQLSEIALIPGKNSTEKFKLCDTGNRWLNLKAVQKLVETDAVNVENYSKSKDDEILCQEKKATSELQAELQLFDHAIGVNVPQSHFQPIMDTSDLLLVQSDLYTCTDGVLTRNNARRNPVNPSIELGSEFQKLSDLQSRVKSIPSMVELDRLKVKGDVWFGAGITLKGKVSITAKQGTKLEIPDGVVLENKEISSLGDM